VADKYGLNDQYLDEVIIHKRNPKEAGNFTVIKSEKGELISSVSSDLLSLVLTNGNYYEEVKKDEDASKKRSAASIDRDKDAFPFIKTQFDSYTINLDLSSLNKEEVSESAYTKNRKMLKASVLAKDIDSFSHKLYQQRKRRNKQEFRRLGLHLASSERIAKEQGCSYLTRDDLPRMPEDFFDYQTKEDLYKKALSDLKREKDRYITFQRDLRRKVERINKFEMALHEKYVLGFGCIVLFFVGAPLGAIIRKGGIGLSLIYALGIFLAYHFIGIFAKNSAEDGSISPFLACWLSTFIILPMGILFTYKATTERNLISLDFMYRFFHKLKSFLVKKFAKYFVKLKKS